MNAILYQNDMLITLADVKDAASGADATELTVEVTLKGVGDTLGPYTLEAVDGKPNTYRGLLPFDADLKVGHTYQVVVTADGGPGRRGRWAPKVRVEERD